MPRISNPPGLQYASGSYTGNGAASRAITGVGFSPLKVKIYEIPAAAGTAEIFEKCDIHAGAFCHFHLVTAGNEHYYVEDRIISLDADGFTIGDAGTDSHPNKNLANYIWYCQG